MGRFLCALSGAVIDGGECFWGYFSGSSHRFIYTLVWPGEPSEHMIEIAPEVRARAAASVYLCRWGLPSMIEPIRDESVRRRPRLVVLHPETVARAMRLTDAQAVIEDIAGYAKELWSAGEGDDRERWWGVERALGGACDGEDARALALRELFAHFQGVPRALLSGPEEVAAIARTFAVAEVAALLGCGDGFPFAESQYATGYPDRDKERRKAVREILSVGMRRKPRRKT